MHGETIQLPRKADREIADVDHLLHFSKPLLQRLAHLKRDEFAEGLLVFAKLEADEPHHFAALGRGDAPPGFEALLRRCDNDFVFRFRRLTHRSDVLARRRGEDFQFRAGGFDPLLTRGRAEVHLLYAEFLQEFHTVL